MAQYGVALEHREAVYERALEFIERVINSDAKTVLVVGHGNFFSLILGGKHLDNCQFECLNEADLSVVRERLIQELTISRRIR